MIVTMLVAPWVLFLDGHAAAADDGDQDNDSFRNMVEPAAMILIVSSLLHLLLVLILVFIIVTYFIIEGSCGSRVLDLPWP